jgi:hypothetical protein
MDKVLKEAMMNIDLTSKVRPSTPLPLPPSRNFAISCIEHYFSTIHLYFPSLQIPTTSTLATANLVLYIQDGREMGVQRSLVPRQSAEQNIFKNMSSLLRQPPSSKKKLQTPFNRYARALERRKNCVDRESNTRPIDGNDRGYHYPTDAELSSESEP